jgi:hypothetical protein
MTAPVSRKALLTAAECSTIGMVLLLSKKE